MSPFLIILSVLLSVFWFFQFLCLLRMGDDAFAGRYDKPIWAATILCCRFSAPSCS